MHHPTESRTVACPEKLGGGGGAQSKFPICDHQNLFNLILIYIYIIIIFFIYIFGGGGGEATGATAMERIVYIMEFVIPVVECENKSRKV